MQFYIVKSIGVQIRGALFFTQKSFFLVRSEFLKNLNGARESTPVENQGYYGKLPRKAEDLLTGKTLLGMLDDGLKCQGTSCTQYLWEKSGGKIFEPFSWQNPKRNYPTFCDLPISGVAESKDPRTQNQKRGHVVVTYDKTFFVKKEPSLFFVEKESQYSWNRWDEIRILYHELV